MVDALTKKIETGDTVFYPDYGALNRGQIISMSAINNKVLIKSEHGNEHIRDSLDVILISSAKKPDWVKE